MSDSEHKSPRPSVGSSWVVEQSEGVWALCSVVSERVNNASGGVQYYIHFTGLDKRLDRWVNVAALLPTTPQNMKKVHPSLTQTDKPTTTASATASPPSTPKLARRVSRRHSSELKVVGDLTGDQLSDPTEAALEKHHEERTKLKNIEKVQIGRYELDAWYFSPYPDRYGQLSRIYHCEYCLKYFAKGSSLVQHAQKCALRHPPGNEIYRAGSLSLFEVDGSSFPIYCQCLCLLAKLFIDHKTLYFDVDPFLFYVMTVCDSAGHHVVGYFSKEKRSPEGNNLACILTFPQYQRRGYGKFLITLSYALTRAEGTTGSPEKPLSDLGKVSYRSYWSRAIVAFLKDSHLGDVTVQDIALGTGIRKEDVVSVLRFLKMLRYHRGENVVVATPKLIQQHWSRLSEKPPRITYKPQALRWVPYHMRKSQKRVKSSNVDRKSASPSSTTTTTTTANNNNNNNNNNNSNKTHESSADRRGVTRAAPMTPSASQSRRKRRRND